MNTIGIIGIVLALATIMFLIIKGFNAIFAAIVATLVVILTNGMPILESMVGAENSYVYNFGQFIIGNYMIFLLGSLLAKYMEASGSTIAIADRVLKWVGKDSKFSVMIALFVISAILTYGGISMFVVVFALIPMAKPLFEELEIDWKLVTIPIFGGMTTFTMTLLPGSPALPNVIPGTILGTPLTSEPVVGIVASIPVIIFVLLYMKHELKKSEQAGEKFSMTNLQTTEVADKENLPSVVASFMPIIVLIATILIFSSVKDIVIVALMASILTAAILFRKNIADQKDVINKGIIGSFGTTLVTGNTIAFGAMLTAAPSFQIISDLILKLPGNPLISLSIATIVISFVTGSGVSTAGIAATTFAPNYLALGISATVIHRVIAISSSVFGIMPHTGLIITFNEVSGLSLKESFKNAFVMVTGTHIIGLVVALIMFSFM